MFLFLISFISADTISTSEKGLITTTITTKQFSNNFIDRLFSIFKNIFIITGVKSSYEKGEIISVTSGFEVESCSSTAVQISLIKGGLVIDTDTIGLGTIHQQSVTALHNIDTSSLSVGTYVLQDYWICGGLPLTSIIGSANPSTKTITITEKVSTCTESWTCGGWGLCPSGVQYRTCTDSNNCGTTFNKPVTYQTCTSTCTPDCTGKCGGVSNGCGGTCDAVCGTCESYTGVSGKCDGFTITDRKCIGSKVYICSDYGTAGKCWTEMADCSLSNKTCSGDGQCISGGCASSGLDCASTPCCSGLTCDSNKVCTGGSTHNQAEISEIKVDKSLVAERGIITVTGRIKNNLQTSQKVLLEVGIIPPSVADAWYIPYETTTAKGEMKWWNWALLLTKFPTLFATVENTPGLQCCNGQTNIEDYWVTLESNEEYPFSFVVQAPHDNITDVCGSTRYWAGYGDYVVYAYLTTGCTLSGKPGYPGIQQGVATARVEVSKLDKESRLSLTKKEWEDSVALEEWKPIISSMCTSTTQCTKREDYEVECTKSDEIWDVNYQAAKDNCGEFISQMSLMMAWGILPEKFANLGCTVFGWLVEFKEDIPRGTCRLSKGAGDICSFFEKTAWFNITGDDCLDGGIIMAILGLLGVIIFSRLSGVFYIGGMEYEK